MQDFAADKAAASEAFTIARRFNSRPPTSTTRTTIPMSDTRHRATMTRVTPVSSPWSRRTIASHRNSSTSPTEDRWSAAEDVDGEDVLDAGGST
jgi:hypothetical protein